MQVQPPVQPQVAVQPPAVPVAPVVPVQASSTQIPQVPKVAEKLTFEEPAVQVAEVVVEETEPLGKFDWNYNAEIDQKLLDFDYDQMIPNANFIYHNKLPKSGSTTMHDILRFESLIRPHQIYLTTLGSSLKKIFSTIRKWTHPTWVLTMTFH